MSLLLLLLVPVLLLPALLLGSAYCAYNWGYPAFAGMALLNVLMFAIGVDLGTVILFASMMIIGGMGGFIIKKKIPLARYVLIAPLLVTMLFSGGYYYKLMNGVDMLADSQKQVTEIFLKRADVSNEDKEKIIGNINATMDVLRNIVPFAIFINALGFAAIGYIAVKFCLFASRKDSPVDGLSAFELNGYVVFGLIGAWAVVLLAGNENKALFSLALNAALIISAFYLVQAFGVISFFLKKNNMPNYLIVMLGVLLFILSMGAGFFMAILLAGFGLLDFWADFRKIHTTENNKSAGA
ncbi:MAG: YybS family protein [Leptospirales bacterium]|nr:YybS family protein [Leptospirales bacterium]